MKLLLTALSVLLAWVFLGALLTSLLAIVRALDSTRGRLERINAGVRAIRKQTTPLGEGGGTLVAGLQETGYALDTVDRRLVSVNTHLTTVTPSLRPR